MLRPTTLIFGSLAVAIVAAVTADVGQRVRTGQSLTSVYADVDATTLASRSAATCHAYDGRRVRLTGKVTGYSAGGPPYELSDGRRGIDGGGDPNAAKIWAVPVPGDPIPNGGDEVVCWGVLNVSRHGRGTEFTLVADRPTGFWSGPAFDLFSPSRSVVLLPYFGVLAAVGLGVRRAWHIHRLRRLQPGCCSACGYDLRWSSGRCPECGYRFPG